MTRPDGLELEEALKKALVVCFVMIAFSLASPALALPDAEVQKLVKSDPAFAKAEQALLDLWRDLPKEFKARMRPDQIEWITNRRDQEAAALMAEGLTFARAYTAVTVGRMVYLMSFKNPQTGRFEDIPRGFIGGQLAYENGDYERAFEIFWPLAVTGDHPLAQYALGMMFHFGQGVGEDKRQAEYWYKKSIENMPKDGSGDAHFHLGLLYLGQEKIDQAWDEFYTASNLGNTQAKYYLTSVELKNSDGKNIWPPQQESAPPPAPAAVNPAEGISSASEPLPPKVGSDMLPFLNANGRQPEAKIDRSQVKPSTSSRSDQKTGTGFAWLAGGVVGILFDPVVWLLGVGLFFALRSKPTGILYGAGALVALVESAVVRSWIEWRRFSADEALQHSVFYILATAVVISLCLMIWGRRKPKPLPVPAVSTILESPAGDLAYPPEAPGPPSPMFSSDLPDFQKSLKEKLQPFFIFIGCAGFMLMGLVQMGAVYAFFHSYWDWPFIFAGLASFFLAYCPILGSIAGFIGALKAWGWEWWQSGLLFFWWPAIMVLWGIFGAGGAFLWDKIKRRLRQ